MNNITTLKPKENIELLAIVVDKDCEYDVDVAGYTNLYNLTKGKSDIIISNKEEKYSILGYIEYNKPIEFDCDGLIDSFDMFIKNEQNEFIKFGKFYKNYVMNDFPRKSKKGSFYTLLQNNDLDIQQLDKENKKLVILQKQ